MLNASKLKTFLEAAQVAVPKIKQSHRVVNDEDVAKDTRNISSNDGIILIGVLPSFGLSFKNEDNYKHNNRLQLFIVKKYDTKSGKEALMDLFDETGATVLQFEAWLFHEYSKFPCRLDIDFQSFDADPVSNYNGFFGYMVQFELKN